MAKRGFLAPETETEARAAYEELGPPAQVLTKEVATAMDFERAEYRERVTSDVVETARDALFASLLEVHVGDRSAFETWLEEHPNLDVAVEGNEHVDRRAWHPVPAVGAVAAVTFQNEPEAAAGTVRRLAFGRFYRDLLAE